MAGDINNMRGDTLRIVKYIWQLVYGLIALVIKGLYQTSMYYAKKLIETIKRA